MVDFYGINVGKYTTHGCCGSVTEQDLSLSMATLKWKWDGVNWCDAYKYIRMYVCSMYICTYVHMYVCTYVAMCMCVCVYV